ncbi:hypothetical protein [Paraburkholderia sp. J67]|uniref:hypothetical protein n=1 Tax=Paraburkholderia sp. J67 TaxID=2805435 RepID=UPI002ABE7B94|nr:hypothetical protein [Paraburkholderia sp. J67]
MQISEIGYMDGLNALRMKPIPRSQQKSHELAFVAFLLARRTPDDAVRLHDGSLRYPLKAGALRG